MTSSRRFSRMFRAFSCGLTLLLYASALIIMTRILTHEGFGTREIAQIGFTLSAMALFALIHHLQAAPLITGGTLLLQFLGGLFLSVLIRPHAWLILLWTVPLIIQTALTVKLIALIPLALTIIAAHFLTDTRAVTAWGTSLPAPLPRDRTAAALIAAAVLLTAAGLRRLFTRLIDMETLVNNLRSNILKLTRANYDFQRYAADAEELTLERERLRISREIHDSIGYTMTTLRMMLEAAADLAAHSPLMLEVQLRKALDIINSGHRDIRISLGQLRERESDRPRGLKGLKNLIDLFREATGTVVLTEWGNLPWNFPDGIEAVLYRFVQEGMSNALSHGKSTEIGIYFRVDAGTLIASISDNGAGAEVLVEGLGLHGMKERIQECGGIFEARNTGEGFLLQARLPLMNKNDQVKRPPPP